MKSSISRLIEAGSSTGTHSSCVGSINATILNTDTTHAKLHLQTRFVNEKQIAGDSKCQR